MLVVGAGQAGLASGAAWQRTGLTFRLFDRAGRVGDSWRRRYDSLVLFSTRAYSSLPGLRMTDDPEGSPSRQEVADYLETFANVLALPITLSDGIAQLTREGDRFRAVTDHGTDVVARAVIVAASAFQRSIVPTFARGLSPDICQVAADAYCNPSQLPDGRVLIVGGGRRGVRSPTSWRARGRYRCRRGGRSTSRRAFWAGM